ncbi:ATP-binding cassette domain-containing protein [Ferrovibrio terrae]|uniref:ATP-binding cassette domain-containing protein n=1 Tax=Ferrovibrio terrae TaxID=2594003 RepID=A0A516GXQ6_9PROT|nr:ATP-binding cassette domain-containing protein [Ferrovibrio terrae]QDO96328.1 ATP-binding cassette domain-containing protein [Ferrovibrio terrae]
MAELLLHGVSVDFPLFFAGDRSFKWNLFSWMSRRTADRHRSTVTALTDISLRVSGGMRLALLGGNAAGKTTLLRVMGGLLTPSRGELALTGRPISVLGTGIGIDPGFTARQTLIGQGLLMGFSPADCRSRMERATEFGELADILDQPLHTLAQGHQVRLGLSIAVAYDAEILLIDEMLEHLPPAVVERLCHYIDHGMSPGSIVVLAERSKPLLERICTTALVLHQGRLIDQGPLTEIAARHQAQMIG